MNVLKLITVAFAATTLACGTAQADEIPTVKVITEGVDLADPAAVSALQKSLRSAAIAVCQTPQERAQGPMVYARACFTKAHTAALRNLQQQVAAAGGATSKALVLATPEQH